MEIENSRILIIGGSSGLGLGITKECTNKGAQVVIASRSEEKLQNAVLQTGERANYHTVDIASRSDF